MHARTGGGAQNKRQRNGEHSPPLAQADCNINNEHGQPIQHNSTTTTRATTIATAASAVAVTTTAAAVTTTTTKKKYQLQVQLQQLLPVLYKNKNNNTKLLDYNG